MSNFCLLDNSREYVGHDWDLVDDAVARDHWLELFVGHFAQTLREAAVSYGRPACKRIESARVQFREAISALRSDPSSRPSGKLDVMELCRLRQEVLTACGLPDPFALIKQRENESALSLYPQVIRSGRICGEPDEWLSLIRGVLAGNIFDLGSPATMKLTSDSPDFAATLAKTKPRPWLVDDYNRLVVDLDHGPPGKWEKAVVFVDNGGTDFILGIMPFVRRLALGGTKVVLAANEMPSLNDLTADETVQLLGRLGSEDQELAVMIEAGMFEVVSTGNDLPLIDLSDVSDELNVASVDAELVVLEGMGRAVESNFDAAFTADSLWLALLKDPLVAGRVGGQVYDCICKYVPSAAGRR